MEENNLETGRLERTSEKWIKIKALVVHSVWGAWEPVTLPFSDKLWAAKKEPMAAEIESERKIQNKPKNL